MTEWIEVLKIAGPTGVVAIVLVVLFLRYLSGMGERLGARIDGVVDRYVTSLETLLGKNQEVMSEMTGSMQTMIKALSERTCIADRSIPQLREILKKREAEARKEAGLE